MSTILLLFGIVFYKSLICSFQFEIAFTVATHKKNGPTKCKIKLDSIDKLQGAQKILS